jgi:hypothetical protein
MGDDHKSRQEDSAPDIPHLIRSIQRINGKLDCFGATDMDCDPGSCCWYELCIKASAKKNLGPPDDRSKKTE